MRKKLFLSFIFVVWVILMGMLIKRNLEPDEIEIIDTQGYAGILEMEEIDVWKGVYYNGKKVGYSHSVQRSIDTGYMFNQETFFKFPILGEIKEIYVDGVTITDSSFYPEKFKLEINSGTHEFILFGELENNILKLQKKIAGHTNEMEFEIDDDFSLPVTFEPMIVEKGLEIGKQYAAEFFDPMTTTKTFVKAEVMELDTLNIMNEPTAAYKLEITLQDMKSYTWVDEKGRVLREEGMMGLTMERESKEMALKVSTHAELEDSDIAFDVAVPSNVKIENPREVFRFNVALSGVDFSDFNLDEGNQRVVKQEKDRVILEIYNRTQALEDELRITEVEKVHPDVELPVTDPRFHEWLKPELLIESDSDKIRSRAKQIIGSEKKLWHAAEKINAWVFNALRKVPTPTIPSALDVLKTKEGDCNEHSILFTALCRAVGIPAKVSVGLVYLEGRFYYHAWNEVWDGEKWIPIEPTFGQKYADATHIKLFSGTLQSKDYISLLKVIGQLEIEVLEYKMLS